MTDGGLEQLWAVPEDVGGHVDAIADHGLRAVAPTVELRRHPFDDDVARVADLHIFPFVLGMLGG